MRGKKTTNQFVTYLTVSRSSSVGMPPSAYRFATLYTPMMARVACGFLLAATSKLLGYAACFSFSFSFCFPPPPGLALLLPAAAGLQQIPVTENSVRPRRGSTSDATMVWCMSIGPLSGTLTCSDVGGGMKTEQCSPDCCMFCLRRRVSFSACGPVGLPTDGMPTRSTTKRLSCIHKIKEMIDGGVGQRNE